MTKVTIPEEVRRISKKRALAFHDSLAKAQPSAVERGQIWSTHSAFDLPNSQHFETDEPRLVVVLNVTNETLTVAPLSIQLSLAAEYDLIVSGENSPLSFDFLVEVWNETPALSNQLRHYLTRLPQHVTKWLDELYAAYLLEEEIPSSLLGYVGPPLMGEDDYRTEFQAAEVEAVEYLARASTAMLGAIEVTERKTMTTSKLRIELGLPTWQKLSDLLKTSSFQLAHAADISLDESHTWMITVKEYPDTKFELLIEKGRLIYLLAHSVDRYLQHKRITIILQSHDLEIVTAPLILEQDKEILVGEIPGFHAEHIKKLYLELEEE